MLIPYRTVPFGEVAAEQAMHDGERGLEEARSARERVAEATAATLAAARDTLRERTANVEDARHARDVLASRVAELEASEASRAVARTSEVTSDESEVTNGRRAPANHAAALGCWLECVAEGSPPPPRASAPSAPRHRTAFVAGSNVSQKDPTPPPAHEVTPPPLHHTAFVVR